MTRFNGPRVPGTILLKIAPRLFSERFVSAVVHPTIADLQSEVAAAGENRGKRLHAQLRGYCAFWILPLAAPFASWAAPAGNDAGSAGIGRFAVGTTVLTLLALTRTMLGVSVAVLALAGPLCALLIHAWYERHPSRIATPGERSWRSPQINLSSTEVAGNIGGLIFVIGSLLIVTVGVPSVLWFLLAGTVAGAVVAWRLVDWRARHPHWGLPENQIVLR